MYEVEYQDGHKASLSANAIAQNMFAQVDEKGNRHILFQEIVDHRVGGKEIKQQDAFITTKTSTRRRLETTQEMGNTCPVEGWQINLDCNEGHEGLLSCSTCGI